MFVAMFTQACAEHSNQQDISALTFDYFLQMLIHIVVVLFTQECTEHLNQQDIFPLTFDYYLQLLIHIVVGHQKVASELWVLVGLNTQLQVTLLKIGQQKIVLLKIAH